MESFAEPVPPAWFSLQEAREAIREGTGKGVRVAVLDSGIEASHPDLRGLALSDDMAVDAAEGRVRIFPGNGEDVFGHGTAVASILRRLAPEAEIGSFRVLGGNLRSAAMIVRIGVQLAIERDYHILNCSFGDTTFTALNDYKSWVDAAYLNRVHVVAACSNRSIHIPEWPACLNSVITVNMARTDDDTELYWRGGHLVSFAAKGDLVDVAWRGGERRLETGSSFAVPAAAARLARLLSRLGPMSSPLAKAVLQQTARPWTKEMALGNG